METKLIQLGNGGKFSGNGLKIGLNEYNGEVSAQIVTVNIENNNVKFHVKNSSLSVETAEQIDEIIAALKDLKKALPKVTKSDAPALDKETIKALRAIGKTDKEIQEFLKANASKQKTKSKK